MKFHTLGENLLLTVHSFVWFAALSSVAIAAEAWYEMLGGESLGIFDTYRDTYQGLMSNL